MAKKISAKDKLRKQVAALKKQYTPQDLVVMSEEVFSVLELTSLFQDAKVVFIYHPLSDEVVTTSLVERWKDTKEFYFPVVKNDELLYCEHLPHKGHTISALGVKEPVNDVFVECSKADLIIVPGVAFDRKMNRLGRGKGYYDRFLSTVQATKVGVCFDFQLFDWIPHDEQDIKMDVIVSENELIW